MKLNMKTILFCVTPIALLVGILLVAYLLLSPAKSTVLTALGEMSRLADSRYVHVYGQKSYPQEIELYMSVPGHSYPTFFARGLQGVITSAGVNCDAQASSLSVDYKECGKGFVVVLFLNTKSNDACLLRDLNADGEWDVKVMPSMHQQHYILYDTVWLPVDKVSGIMSDMPMAQKGVEEYEFKGGWIRVE